jgi:hypothetical protein
MERTPPRYFIVGIANSAVNDSGQRLVTVFSRV